MHTSYHLQDDLLHQFLIRFFHCLYRNHHRHSILSFFQTGYFVRLLYEDGFHLLHQLPIDVEECSHVSKTCPKYLSRYLLTIGVNAH